MQKERSYQKLRFWGQEHLLSHFENLSDKEKIALLQDIESIDFSFFEKARQDIQKDSFLKTYTSFKNYETWSKEWEALGWELIRKGQCALLVLAGGSGSRFSCEGPKGSFPLTLIKKKSIFQCISEKLLILSRQASVALEMAIMTSPSNHEQTISFFHRNNFFGLESNQVHFFPQKEWPLLSLEGNLFLETPGKIARGANGNGTALQELYRSPIYGRWQEKKITCLRVMPIDNPLADPFDAALFGYHVARNADLTIQASFRKHQEEKVGLIVEGGSVVEYGEGQLENQELGIAYLGLFCLRFSEIEKIAHISLPIHRAKKKVKAWLEESHKSIFSWKYENFLFDNFAHLRKVCVLLYPRERCFAPLKNFSGEDSITTVQKQLLNRDREVFFQVTGTKVPENAVFELAFDFYYPTEDVKNKWYGKKLPHNPYIEAL